MKEWTWGLMIKRVEKKKRGESVKAWGTHDFIKSVMSSE